MDDFDWTEIDMKAQDPEVLALVDRVIELKDSGLSLAGALLKALEEDDMRAMPEYDDPYAGTGMVEEGD